MAAPVFKVSTEEARQFSQVWTYKGLVVPLQETHTQFAADFANVVLRNFIEQCQQTAQAAKSAPATTMEKQKRQLIVEGVA